MNKVKHHLLMLGFILLIMLFHFFGVIYSSSEQDENEHVTRSTLVEKPFNRSAFTAKELSDLFAINYKEIVGKNDNEQAGVEEVQSQILLNDIDVFIRAISQVNGRAIIYVSYEQDGKLQREKIAINDQLFGYTLINVSRGLLTFERDEQIINYTIFKAKKKTEGNR
ncbi:putative general secretion pathway protein [Aliivibrio wodanis]|uniref:Putative general secretion pathway protein n=1 Tax=Aliivibrio wodanis TaxID=80852 RepID=A0A090IPS8_9GAMM|nr:putative general secretion pathway protein [Aliivibrio wodanis]